MESTPESQPKPELLKERPTEFNRVTVGELEQQCHDLRTLLNATFVALLVLSLSVNLFLGKQMRLVRAKVSESRPVIQRMQAEFQKKEPNMRSSRSVPSMPTSCPSSTATARWYLNISLRRSLSRPRRKATLFR